MTVKTRAIDLRTVALMVMLRENAFPPRPQTNVHLGQLRRRAAGNLLHSQSKKLILQLQKLLRQVILGPINRVQSIIAANRPSARTWIEVRRP